MTIATVLSWMLCGLIVGLVARLLVPGRQNMNFLLTIGLGIVGALVGGFLFWLAQGTPREPYSLAENAWQGWILSILGATLVLWVFVSLFPKRWQK